jgi:hypothetical protein
MFKRNTEYVDPRLDSAIDNVITRMEGLDNDSPQYAPLNEHLVKLLTLKQNTMPKRASNGEKLVVAANLAGIVAILASENTRVVASKAIGFVLKAR